MPQDYVDQRIQYKRRMVLVASGAATFLLGIVALGGWQTPQLDAFRLAHGWVPAHCGIAFSFAGLSLVLAAFSLHRLVQLAGLAIELVAAVILVDQLWGLPAGWSLPFPLAELNLTLTLTPYALRITAHSLLCFSLLGVALILMGMPQAFRQRGLILALLGAMILALPISEIIGFVLDVNTPNAEGFWSVVLFTAPAHLLTAWGIITFAWYDTPPDQREHVHWPPLLLIVGVLSATLLLWDALDSDEDRDIASMTGVHAVAVTSEIERDVRSYVGGLLRIARRWEHPNQPSLAFREFAIRQYLTDFAGMRSVESLDNDGHARWRVGNPGVSVAPQHVRLALLAKARERNAATLSDFIVDGPSIRLYMAIPVRERGAARENAFLFATFDVPALLEDILSHPAVDGYAVAIWQNTLRVYGLHQDRALDRWRQDSVLNLYGTEWHVSVAPTPIGLTTLGSAVPRIVLVAGMLLAVLLAWVDYLAYKANMRARDLTQEVERRQRAEGDLHRLNDELEHRVRQRTLELREANRNLAAEKELLDVTLRSIGDAVITCDIDGRVLSINKVAEELTDWREGEAVGQPIDAVFRIVDVRTRRALDSPHVDTVHNSAVTSLGTDTLLVARDGRERMIADSAAPIRDRQGKIVGVVLAFRDISETRKMEEDLFKAKNLEAIGLLAGGIAHDFNNILTAILGHVALAKLYATPGDPIYQNLAQAEKAFGRARDLTLQLLTFSKGGAPIRKAASIAELVQDTTGFVLRGSNIRYEIEAPPDLWPASIDPGQISQALNNLLINAKQAMPRGGVISIALENMQMAPGHPRLRAGRYVKLTLRDQGTGIAPNDLPKIFDPYFSTKEGGTGLGLATTYSIIKRHQGDIEVASVLGEGTAFQLYLPAAERVFPEHEVVPSVEDLHGQGRVLVMDDEETIRDVAAKMLRALGYESVLVATGDEAVAAYRDAQQTGAPFDAVLLDLTVAGGMGGKECLDRLREIDPDVIAILSSGYSNDPVMANYRRHGFLGMVAKPYQLEELGQTLARILPRRSRRRGRRASDLHPQD